MDENLTKANQEFANVCSELTVLHENKNHDYGDGFAQLFRKKAKRGKVHAMNYALSHLEEKVNRIDELTFEGAMVKGESIEDSLKDLASYAIMTLAEYRKLPKGVEK